MPTAARSTPIGVGPAWRPFTTTKRRHAGGSALNPHRGRTGMATFGKEPLRTDVAVVGAGAAGLYAALTAAREGARVVLVSRSPLAQSASYWAQGGIAAALSADDSVELHLRDTLKAGRGAGRESAARVLCEQSPAAVHNLQELGVHFDAE